MTAIRRIIANGVHDLRVRRFPVEPAPRPDGRGPYPLIWHGLPRQTRLDSDGVVVVDHPENGSYPNPVSMCLYALSWHSRVHHDAPADPATRQDRLAPLLTQARWLREHQDPDGGWRYPVPIPRYRVPAGWYSGMAQGLAVSTLLRAYDLTDEKSFADSADGAIELLLRSVDQGGCADYDVTGRPFLEECAKTPANHVLNGAIFALFGLIEHQHRRGGTAHVPAQQRLADELGHYDLGYWSRYDREFAWPATANYHSLHVSLLTALAKLTGQPVFQATAVRWRRQLTNPIWVLRARTVKAAQVWRHRHV
ncbi:D-glucuronyl C5-epimerase family protein [Micromonospora sp. CPCC 206060]|uniref:D-glucuronyl C5-epimerase family protein n=1 Tax=Micromonospora sp. CPCC 206060 TaxID=3122406 RepID=UPI002FF302CA